MRDIHRDRLTHLLANAIVELWKKETGSLSSVVIEGTICITSGTGKTTVLQVADRYSGSIPEAEDRECRGGGHSTSFSSPESTTGRFMQNSMGVMRSYSMPHCYTESAPPRVDCHNQTAMAAFLDNLSPASLVSPGTEYSRSSRESRSPTTVSTNREHTESSVDVSSGSIKDELNSESGSDSAIDENKNVSVTCSADGGSTGAVCPGTGYYTCAITTTTTEVNNNTIDPKYTPQRSRSPRSSPDRNKRRHSRGRSKERDSSVSERKRSSLDSQGTYSSPDDSLRDSHELDSSMSNPQVDAVDLTRKGVDDLALSPPQNYTAQVRDVIRHKLLASKSGEESELHAQRNRTPHSETPAEDANTAKILESLGFQRNVSGPRLMTDRRTPERSEGDRIRSYSESRADTQHSLSHLVHEKSTHSMEGVPLIVRTHENMKLSMSLHGTPVSNSSSSTHPLLINPISPIMSTGSSICSLPSPIPSTNGPLHSILRHRPFPPLPLGMHRTSIAHAGPNSAPPLFTHPGFSPLQGSMPQHSPRDASPSPTDLSLDSSGDSEKEVGPNGEQRVYRCEYCTKTFLFKSKYHEHLPVHTNARPFQCHLCSRTYKYKYDLRVHLRTHMGIPTKSTVCPFCNTKFDTNKRLRVHIKDAHRDKQKMTEEDYPVHAQQDDVNSEVASPTA